MKKDKKEKSGKTSYIFTRETLGMTLMLFSAIVFLMLLSGSAIFAGIGQAICTFMYGVFGYGSWLVVGAIAYLGEWLVFEKRIKFSKKTILLTLATTFVFFLLFHAVTTRGISLENYGSYLGDCYMHADMGWSGYTFGGVISGLIVYPVAKLTTFIGAYVIFSLLLALCGYCVFLAIKGKVSSKSEQAEIIKREEPEEEEDVKAQIYAASQAVADTLYTVNSENEIVTKRELREEEQRREDEYLPENKSAEEKPAADDKYSRENLGRRILFDNDEFAAESYRRNMIFSEDSYFNHPVTTREDYLSSFSSGKKNEDQNNVPDKTYSESYQDEVMRGQEPTAPVNYVYGEKPVENIEDFNRTEQNPSSFVDKADEANTYEPIEPAHEEYEEKEEHEEHVEPPVFNEPREEGRGTRSDMSLRSLFGGDSMRGDTNDGVRETPRESAREELPLDDKISENDHTDSARDSLRTEQRGDSLRSEQRGERSNAGLFDNLDEEDDDDTDVFGRSLRPSDRSARTQDAHSELHSTEESPRIPPVSPRGEGRGLVAPAPKPAEPAPQPPAPKPKHIWKKYVYPPLELLDDYPENNNVNTGEIESNKQKIVETLNKFKITSEVTNVTIGPAVTRYDIVIEDQTNIKRSLTYAEEIAMEVRKKDMRMYRNFSKGVVSIEIPNEKRATVGLKSMLTSPKFINCKPNSLTFGLGKNIDGDAICPDITRMPHLLVAGATGSGKSICLSSLLVSLLYKYSPEELRLILVDPKQVEFAPYDGLPHLMINEIITEVDKAIKALNWSINEMNRRYMLFNELTKRGTLTKNLDEYNKNKEEDEEKLPKILIILDEFGDLMMQAKRDIESKIIILAQKARAAGIHLILATQRPSVDCITGLIKSNLPTRIGFKVNSIADSSTIFDIAGAEKLLGMGDLYLRSTDNPDLVRVQGCFVDSHEVQKVTDYVKQNNETFFDQEATDFINKVEEPEEPVSSGGESDDPNDSKIDETYIKALKYCVKSNQASVSMIQRRFPFGYIKACKIIDWMANMNYITQSEGSKPRKVLLTQEEFENIFGEVDD